MYLRQLKFQLARRDASAVLAVARGVCACLCLSITNSSSIETDGRVELGLARKPPLAYHSWCCQQIGISRKQGYALPSGTLSQTLDLENFVKVIIEHIGCGKMLST